jgi:hypothetical protein
MKPGGFSERIWRSRWLKPVALIAVFLLLATLVPLGPRPGLGSVGDAPLLYTPVPLDAGDPDRREVGRLHFLGGWTMSSPDDRFGGLSGLAVGQSEAVAVSDTGMVISFPLPGASAAPRVRFQPAEQGPGSDRNRRSRDTEALQLAGNQLWLSFERYNAVWRYDRTTMRPLSAAQPVAMRRWRGNNSGPEAMVRLADGRFLLIQEGIDNGRPTSEAVLFAGDPSVPGTPGIRLAYRRPPGFRATDAALLPDGRVLILNRGLAWLQLSAKLVVADVRGLQAGGTIAGQEVATLAAPLAVDNMEGVSVTRERGRTIVWLISDDDYMRLFRHTLLLKFELRL